MPAATPQISPEEAVRRIAQVRETLVGEVHKVIIGQDEMIEQMLICTFARGHCLTIGVPGLAKTLTVSTLAQALQLKFMRIQFTPDLMPSDITGTEIIDQDPASGKRTFRFVRGPVFSNIVLADEINRTPPKTQAALLQAMQEHEVTVAGNTYKLEPPFFVMATQNPIEQEGTYPLPEAQLDRFMLSINISYPTRNEEREIVIATTQTGHQEVRPVLHGQDNVREHRPAHEPELPLAGGRILVDDLRARDVAGHQVGRELNARELQVQSLGQGRDGQRLCQARHADRQAMPPGECADEHLLDHLVLADNDLVNLADQCLAGLGNPADGFFGTHLGGRGRHQATPAL